MKTGRTIHPSTQSVLDDLEQFIKQIYWGFPATCWRDRQHPDAPERLFDCGFRNLDLPRGATLDLECDLRLPPDVFGIRLDGEPLLVRISSLFPVTLYCDGQRVFHEDGVPVAAGPALRTWVDRIDITKPARLRCLIHVPDQQPFPGVYLHCYTPSMLKRFEQLDTAWAQLAWANAIAASPAQQQAVRAATPLAARLRTTTDDATLARLCRQLGEALQPLHAVARRMRMHLIGHSHIDLCWLWRHDDTVEVIRRDLRSVLKLMDEFPELVFSFSQPHAYQVMQQSEPALFKQLLRHVKSGRWEPLTLQWVESDLLLSSGEAQARQLLEGVRYTRDVLGVQPTVFHAPDTFGHAGNTPQLALSAGAKFYYHHRCNPGGADFYPAYWWEGDDGSRILALSSCNYNGEISAGNLVRAAIRSHRHGLPCGLYFHGIGDHGGGPSRQNLNLLRSIQQAPCLPVMTCSRLDAFGQAVLDSGVALPIHRGESRTIFEGCYTTHADTKRYNRHAETLLTTAGTLAALAGQQPLPKLQQAWRSILFNQFHDILCGSSIRDVYDDQARDFSRIKRIGNQLIDKALTVLHAGFDASAIAVTNPLGTDRRDLVRVPELPGTGTANLLAPDGKAIIGQYTAEGLVFVADVPAFASVAYCLAASKPARRRAGGLSVEEAFAPAAVASEQMTLPPKDRPYYQVETPFFTALVRRNCGIICSLLDKRAKRELVGYGINPGIGYDSLARPDLALNVFQVYHESPHEMSAWQFQEVRSHESLLNHATVRIAECGPVRCVLRVEHRFNHSRITEDIIFYRDLARIDFACDIDWHEAGNSEVGVYGLKVAFNTRLLDAEAWFESPYGAVRRPADGQEVPAQRWVDVGGDAYGAALLNESKYGHDVMGTQVRLNLLRNAYGPDPQSDSESHQCAWSYLPHAGNWRQAGIVQAAAGFNQPLLAKVKKANTTSATCPHTFRPPRLVGGVSAQMACLKPAEDGRGLILRLVETAGQSNAVALDGLVPRTRVVACDLTERDLAPVDIRKITLAPWQVMSLRITI